MDREEQAKADAALATVADMRVHADKLRQWTRWIAFPNDDFFQEDLLYVAAVLDIAADAKAAFERVKAQPSS